MDVIGQRNLQRKQLNPERMGGPLHVATLSGLFGLLTLSSTPTLRAPGTISTVSASCLLGKSSTVNSTPVTLPPGRAWLAARPKPTGSTSDGEIMGMVSVNFLAIVTPVSVPDTITSGFRRTSSSASEGTRAKLPSAYRPSRA